ncbi:MAG: MFS transporter [Nanoarchaeota archaeon]|nr:MFS transporter [Nanoarchaeota archaeon]
MRKYLSLLWPLYAGEFFRSLSFFVPIWILFFQARGLSLAEIGFVATGTYLASVLLEYPSGIFADKYGRKLSIISSIFLSAVALIIEVTAYSTTQFFIGALFIGASFAFSSGAREALIYDSLKEKKLEKFNSKVLGSLDTLGAVGGILASLLGSIFFTLNNILPYWLTITAYGLGLFFFIFIREPKYKNNGEVIDTLKNFKEGLKLVWKNPVLKSLLLIYIPLFFFEEAWYNAQQPILVGLGLPILFLGTYQAAKTIFFAIGGVTLPKLLDKFSHKTLLLSIIIIEFLVWIILGMNNLYAVIIFAYILILLHQLWNYVDADIIHDHISSHVRATTLSARQMLISLIWIFNPWVMGYLVNTFNRNILFPIFGFIILIAALSIFLSRKRYF